MIGIKRIQTGFQFYSILLPLLFVCPEHAKAKTDKEALQLAGPVRSVAIVKDGRIESTQNYDNNGNMVEELFYFTNGSVEKTVTSIDDKGTKVESKRYTSTGKVLFKTVFIYDPGGNLIEEKQLDSQDVLRGKKVYTNDDKGNAIEMVVYRDSATVKSRYVYTYDDKGNVIEEKYYKRGSNALNSRVTYTYDDKGNKVQDKTYDADGSWAVSHIYSYDSKGNMVDEKIMQADGLNGRNTFTYEYDSNGNWTKRVSNSLGPFDKRPRVEVIGRNITYY
jgi:hypothetical protein